MSQDKQKSIAAMRTFARDLDRERGHTTDNNAAPVEPKKISAKERHEHVAAAPKVVADVPKTAALTTIPAFHELQKKGAEKTITPTLQAPTPVQQKTPSSPAKNPPVGGGMIITDTKIERTSFFAALTTSLTAWFTRLKKELEPSKKQTYSVTSTERRRGVVQKATSKTGAMFSADKAELQAIIRKRQLEKTEGPHDPELEWSPFTEPGYLLLDGEHEAIINPPVLTPPPAAPVPPKPPVVTPIFVPPAPPAPVVPIVPVPPRVVAAVIPTPPSPNPQPLTTVVEPSLPLTQTVTKDTVEDEVALNEPEPKPASPSTSFWSLQHLTHLSTNEMTMLVVGALFVVTAISFTGYLTLSTPEQTEVIVAVPGPESVTTLTPRPLLITPDKTSLTLITTAADAERAVELFTVRSDGSVDSGFLQAAASADGDAFVRASREARLVVTASGERALLIPIVDTVNARGGLLDWERVMYRDVAQLFTNTSQAAVTATFSDASLLGIDTRQVQNGETVVLMYGFVTSELVIIAPSVSAFSEAVSLLKK